MSLFTSAHFANAGTNPIKINDNQSVRRIITAADVAQYLIQTGHTVVNPPVLRSAGTWVSVTNIKNDGHTYLTEVLVEGEYIIGYEDSPID